MENLQAEKSVLSSLLKKGSLIKETTLEPPHFTDPVHKQIFEAMIKLHDADEPIDVVSVYTQIGSDIVLFGGTAYLSELAHFDCHIKNFHYYERYVMDSYRVREAKSTITKIQEEITSGKDLSKLEAYISEISALFENTTIVSFDLDDSILKVSEDLITKRQGLSGIESGFDPLNTILDGWQLQELNILAARPSVGKTSFALCTAYAAAKSDHFVNVFSLEMNADLIVKRLLSMIGGIDSLKLKNAPERFNAEDWRRFEQAQTTMLKNNISIFDRPSPTLVDIRGEIIRNIDKYPDKKHLVVIDYLTLIKTKGRNNRTQEVGELSRGLKEIAREFNCSVLLLSQLNRSVEYRQNKRPMLSDIRESGEIEQDADVIIFLYRDDYYPSGR
ncbi:DnaB-like helicase C-terminal domain-containing protein [Bacillus sp. Marseille-Q3570]|uniref:replicative DNA helicase n=1 Tax=Bacillus sp. Marseille-Q3570 TaxID=2963522 RepID=UPI0021B6E7F8|nr:DnaB-like helicase C-terminal domain-containing protein [Bacillus sp. Marseille-Q3570]